MAFLWVLRCSAIFHFIYTIAGEARITINEVPITGGVAGASSQWDDGNFKAANGFNSSTIAGWHTGKIRGAPDPFPVYLWYDFTNKWIRPADISFRPRQDSGKSGTTDHAPTKYQFVGTNDQTCNKSSAWTILCEDVSGAPFVNKFETRYCPVREPVDKSGYRCLGLRILGTSAVAGLYPGHASVNNIRMWEMGN